MEAFIPVIVCDTLEQDDIHNLGWLLQHRHVFSNKVVIVCTDTLSPYPTEWDAHIIRVPHGLEEIAKIGVGIEWINNIGSDNGIVLLNPERSRRSETNFLRELEKQIKCLSPIVRFIGPTGEDYLFMAGEADRLVHSEYYRSTRNCSSISNLVAKIGSDVATIRYGEYLHEQYSPWKTSCLAHA